MALAITLPLPDPRLRFAQCMRDEGVEVPDPDPIRGLTLESFRAEDGGLIIDPFSREFQEGQPRRFSEGPHRPAPFFPDRDLQE